MAACEKCWSIFKERQLGGLPVTYADVLAEFDGKHTAAECCGELHVLFYHYADDSKSCRCGKRMEPSAPSAAAVTGG